MSAKPEWKDLPSTLKWQVIGYLAERICGYACLLAAVLTSSVPLAMFGAALFLDAKLAVLVDEVGKAR